MLKHGLKGKKIYNIWKDMRQRCNNKNHHAFNDYGGRGIKVCEDWDDAKAFYDWAMSNGYKETLTIDRIDNDGNYEPDNCRWTTIKAQCNNRRSNHLIFFNGVTHTMSEWCEILNIPYDTLRARLNTYHWTVEKALMTPVRKYRIFVRKEG